MEILEVSESLSEDGGLNVRFHDGTREFNYHLFDGLITARAAQLRVLLKEYKGKTITAKQVKERKEKEAKELREKTVKARLKAVNDQLKELGEREIKTIEEIPNAKAFIQFSRAEVFKANDGK